MFPFTRRNWTFLAAAVVAANAACDLASPSAAFSLRDGNSNPWRRTRQFDQGGSVLDYYESTHAVDYRAHRTVISGVCASACTMKLGMRNACIEPEATLLFHQASSNGVRSELGTRVMLYAYPQRIQQWALRSGALSSSNLTALSGQEAIAMGVQSCRTDVRIRLTER